MPTTLTKDNYEKEALKSEKPAIVEIFAEWCGKCQQMMPIFEELEEEYGDTYNFLTIDVEEASDLVNELGVTSVPTFLFIKKGEIKGTEHGYMPKEDFIEKIKKHLA